MSEPNGNGDEAREKRLAILERAIQNFANLGFRGADVQIIADQAGVGKGTVYRHFHNKEDLFWAAAFEVLLRLDRAVFGAMEGVEGACAKVKAATAAYARFFEQHPQYLEVFLQGRAEFRSNSPESHRIHHQQMIRRLEKILQQGIDSGELRPIDTTQTTLTLGSLMYGIVVLGGHLSSQPAGEITDYGVDMFLRGLRAHAGCSQGENQP